MIMTMFGGVAPADTGSHAQSRKRNSRGYNIPVRCPAAFHPQDVPGTECRRSKLPPHLIIIGAVAAIDLECAVFVHRDGSLFWHAVVIERADADGSGAGEFDSGLHGF